ncbi:MAG: redox-sensing transcriptional repressor Rex [Eubacterium sp.]|nr:redox-sensing transcriptional repressor Rex [Eubacterium sp.]MCI6887316.1 redox-sensing transcriptional repressor Rex [Lachnospiraceae bacterium]
MELRIPKAVFDRLPRYYRYLGDLMDLGINRTSSYDLAERMSYSATLIRHDMSTLGDFGRLGYGYDVPYLHTKISEILGINRCHNIIVIGSGNLGHAIVNHSNFAQYGFVMKGMFDVDPRLIGMVIRGIEIQPLDRLETFIQEQDIQIAAVTIPKNKADNLVDRLVRAGIKGIWNFSHLEVNVPENVVVEDVHLSESLMKLLYQMNHR